MEALLRDLRFSLRRCRSAPAFTAAAVLTLALGIGANTAIFSLVDAVLLRVLPYRDANQLVWVWATRTDRDKAFYSVPNFIDTIDGSHSFVELGAFANWGANLTGDGEPVRLQGVRLSAHAFRMLGVEAAAGRLLIDEDDDPGKPRVVVLSYGLWQRRFGGNREVIGQPINLNGEAYTVAGVLPAHFTIPNAEIEIAAPLRLASDPRRRERGSNFLRVFGRLEDGVTLAQARAQMASITEQLREKYPDNNAKLTAPNVLPLHDEIVGGYRTPLWLLLGAVGLVLLIACSNLANLLLARATARKREIALYAPLGATRFAIVRQMLTESLLLSVAGGALGVLLAVLGRDLLLAFRPADLLLAGEVLVDGRVLLFSLTISVLAGIVFGLGPALQTTKTGLQVELMGGGRGSSGGSSSRLRDALVVLEVALSLILLVGAGLLITSFMRLQSVSPGFEPGNLLAVRLSLPAAKYSRTEQIGSLYDRLGARLSALPGVDGVGAANVLPLSGMISRTEFTISDRPPLSPTETPAAQSRWVSPAYLQTMKIPIIEGRDLNEHDDETGAPVVVIDEALARRNWRNESPIGSHLRLDFGNGDKPHEFEVVGVCGNVKHSRLNEEATATLYAPLHQIPQSMFSTLAANLSIVVRSAADPRMLTESVRRELQSVDPEVPASNVKTMAEFLAASVASRRFNLLLLTTFAGAALVLAAAGLYGVVSYTITQRTREIGIRMALGGNPRDMLRLVIGQGMRLALIGVGLGLAAALALTRLMSSLLFGVNATDPLTFAVIAVLLTAVALVACWIPARRATKVDPLVALRYE